MLCVLMSMTERRQAMDFTMFVFVRISEWFGEKGKAQNKS